MAEMNGRIETLPDRPPWRTTWPNMTTVALAAKGVFRVAVRRLDPEGLSTPPSVHRAFPVDARRLVRATSASIRTSSGSNDRMTREAMLSKAPVPPANVHPVPADGTPDQPRATNGPCRRRMAPRCSIRAPMFDITLLELGPDGDTASLLPGEPVLVERKRWVAAVSHGPPRSASPSPIP